MATASPSIKTDSALDFVIHSFIFDDDSQLAQQHIKIDTQQLLSWTDAINRGASISDRIAQSEKNERRKLALERARKRLSLLAKNESTNTLSSLRLARGLSQKQLADAINSKQSYIARIERKRADVRSSTISKLSKALGVQQDEVRLAMESGWKLEENLNLGKNND